MHLPEPSLHSASRLFYRITVATTLILGVLALPAAMGQGRRTTSTTSADFAALSARADAARDADRLDDAIALYKRALSLRPSWAEGWWSLGTLYYDRDVYDKAAVDFQKVIALRPQDGTAEAMLGLCEFELGHDERALRHIQRGKYLGLQKNPDLWHVVLYHEGVLLQRKGSFQAAQDTLEELCLQTGASDKAANVLGMAMLRRAAKDPPPTAPADAEVVLGIGRAECLAGQKKYDEAKPAYEGIVAKNSHYANVHYAFGLFLIELRDVAGAVEQFKQEIANHPDNVLARLRIAAVEYKENSAAGIPYAEEAVKLDPQQPFGHYLLGLLLLDTDDYQRAIPELEIASKSFPREAKIYFALGTAYSRAGRRQDAVRARATFQRLNDEGKKSVAMSERDTGAGQTRIPAGDAPSLPQ